MENLPALENGSLLITKKFFFYQARDALFRDGISCPVLLRRETSDLPIALLLAFLVLTDSLLLNLLPIQHRCKVLARKRLIMAAKYLKIPSFFLGQVLVPAQFDQLVFVVVGKPTGLGKKFIVWVGFALSAESFKLNHILHEKQLFYILLISGSLEPIRLYFFKKSLHFSFEKIGSVFDV